MLELSWTRRYFGDSSDVLVWPIMTSSAASARPPKLSVPLMTKRMNATARKAAIARFRYNFFMRLSPNDYRKMIVFREKPAAGIAGHQMMHRIQLTLAFSAAGQRRRCTRVSPPETRRCTAVDDGIIIADFTRKKCGKCPAPQSIFHKLFLRTIASGTSCHVGLCNTIQKNRRYFYNRFFDRKQVHCHSSGYPIGFIVCQRYPSRHISSIVLSAFQPRSSAALSAFA